MKRVLVILAFFALIAIGMLSCKTTDDCPAYSKAQKAQRGVRV